MAKTKPATHADRFWMCTHCGKEFNRSPWNPKKPIKHECGDPPVVRHGVVVGQRKPQYAFTPVKKTPDYAYTKAGKDYFRARYMKQLLPLLAKRNQLRDTYRDTDAPFNLRAYDLNSKIDALNKKIHALT